jgi:hypothetical protein
MSNLVEKPWNLASEARKEIMIMADEPTRKAPSLGSKRST